MSNSDLPFLGQGRIKPKPDGCEMKIELWCRAENVLRENGIGSSHDEIKAAILSGALSPKRTRQYGKKTHKRLCEYVGLPRSSVGQLRASLERLKEEVGRLEALIPEELDVNPNLPW
jgi:hypothetical protein